MEKQMYQVGDKIKVERGDKWVTTKVIRVEWDEKMQKFYYYTKMAKGIGYPIAGIQPVN